MITLDFSGKNAIVTGGGSGIGKAIALQLAEAGANVWLGEIMEAQAAGTLQELAAFGGTYGATRTDVGVKAEVDTLFDAALAQFGSLDIVVNSAGVFLPKHFAQATPDEIKRHLDINLLGTIYSCQRALTVMTEQGRGGKIVNISSVGGRQGDPEFPFYALGKAGVLNLTQSLAYAAAPHRINCNAVCPGIIRTPMWDTILKGISGGSPDVDLDKLFEDVLKSRTPLGVAQTGADIAYTVLFLCSQYADQVTGQAWNVCGGAVMS